MAVVAYSDPNIFVSIAYPESESGGLPELTPISGQIFRIAFGGKAPIINDDPQQSAKDLQATLMEISGLKRGSEEDRHNPHFRWNVIQREQITSSDGTVGVWAVSPVLQGRG